MLLNQSKISFYFIINQNNIKIIEYFDGLAMKTENITVFKNILKTKLTKIKFLKKLLAKISLKKIKLSVIFYKNKSNVFL